VDSIARFSTEKQGDLIYLAMVAIAFANASRQAGRSLFESNALEIAHIQLGGMLGLPSTCRGCHNQAITLVFSMLPLPMLHG
jgi:hypothetical protein